MPAAAMPAARLVGEFAALQMQLPAERRAKLEADLRYMLMWRLYAAAAGLLSIAMRLAD
ncbi:hypothetical protein C2E21_7272 [Chlorella sorokiniana]|uniref:Uncharacterized protein n=1 Tax=Chlorella sorokiniana TaxID=3076 RepID=A0A2P6THJ6_CHLSO|nr:hypothetical protein C2E21_7272 [Chlorella sorokiniana]|eukprot:PRW33765.1 hypothetical protein C2E21_7272 [Chlorella sorokiniana]